MNFSIPDLQARPRAIPVPHKTSPLDQRIEVFVLTNHRKPATTPEMLDALGIPYRRYDNPDWKWPEDHPELQIDRAARPMVRDYALRQYRAFKGHQAILQQVPPEKLMLVFEDDAGIAEGVTPEVILQHLNAAPRFLERYEAVSFHARNQSPAQSSVARYGREYVELRPRELTGAADWGHDFFLKPVIEAYDGRYRGRQFRWHEGCLAYLIGPTGRQKWIAAGHGHGMPCDLFLANELHTIVLRETIFSHDDRHGSLIADTVKHDVATGE